MAREVTPTAPRVAPAVTPANFHYWTGGASGELRILRNKRTNAWISPFEDDSVEGAEPVTLSGKATVYTFTVNYQKYHPDVQPPYVVALVELVEAPGIRLPTNIVNCATDAIEIGMPVRVVFEPCGEYFLPLFEPDM
ncbi:MAG: OB-fold domain-containing protein [Caulobacterales bacterium]